MAGTPYFIGSGSQASGGTGTITITAGANVTLGDSIMVCVGTTNVTNDAVSITDSQNNSYNEIEGPTGSGSVSGSVWQSDGSAALVSGTDQIFITLPGSAPTAVLVVGDNNVGITITPEDQNISATGVSNAPNSGSTGTLDQTFEHAIAFIVDLGAGGVPTWASPWSSHVLGNVTDSGTAVRCSASFQDVTATTALEATGTITSTSWVALLATNNVTNLQIANNSVPNGVVNLAYTVALSSIGGVGAVTYSLVAGAGTLPTGLNLSSAGVISGTPVAAGTYDFTVKATAATFGPATTQTFSINIAPSGPTGSPSVPLYGNLLSSSDSSALAGFTWAAFSNASSVSLSSRQALSGANSFLWTASANGTTAIRTGTYNATPNKSYVLSSEMLPLAGTRNFYIGVRWLTSNGSLISTSGGPSDPNGVLVVSQGTSWTPVYNLVTSPPTTAKAQVVVWCEGPVGTQVLAGEPIFLDQVFFTQSNIQVMVDFQNPAFVPLSNTSGMPPAGAAFQDLTPWIRHDIGVNYTRGRQDAISEMQAGSAGFTLQNDTGIFTKLNSSSFLNFVGPNGSSPTLQQRVQINFSDTLGNWYTRYDGQVSEIDYSYDNTGNTSTAVFSATDILAYLNRQPSLNCWTYESILATGPLYFWPLNDYDQIAAIVSFNQNTLQQTVNVSTSGFSLAAEVMGNGPSMRISNRADVVLNPSGIAWADTTYGVETLADAVQPNALDGSEFWSVGTDQPTTPTRGLDSGNVGPFSTPLPNINLTADVVPGTGKNKWINNQGWELIASLNAPQSLNLNESDYTIELFFMSAPALVSNVSGVANSPFWAQDVGPFICLGVGNSRDLNNIAAGIYIGNSTATFQVNTYTNPPAWGIRSFSSSSPIGPTGTISQSYTPDESGCPHHLAIVLQGGSTTTGATISAYLDGALMPGNITLTPNQLFDTISVGGPHGGGGNWYGSVSCAAVYDSALSSAQIIEHCQRGQYGAWEEATDQCIAELAEYANIPSYWFNINASDSIGLSNALSLTDYVDITGQNAFSNMQLYEATENGTLFVNSSGQLTLHTRDWKMGYGGPNLVLPPDTFDGTGLGYELVDQFQVNQMAISSVTFPTGGSFTNQTSVNSYGVYAQNPIGSPLQLPIITFNRGFATLGLPSLSYYSDPYIDDLCSWIATTRGNPYFTAASVNVDLFGINPATGLSVADFYNLEIGMVIAPSGTLPVSFPNEPLSNDWFVEGITETYSLSEHKIEFFTSPASTQEAWIPGDSTYGVLGSTTTLGISATDTNAPEADGKDVSHDAGPPYWPPNFVDNVYFDDTIEIQPVGYWPLDGTSAQDASGSGFDAFPLNATAAVFGYQSSPVAGASSCVQLFAAAQSGLVSSFSPSGGSQWTMECWVNLNGATQVSAINTNPRIFSSSHTVIDHGGFEIYLANGNVPTYAIGNGSAQSIISAGAANAITANSGWHSLILTWDGVAGVVTAYLDFAVVGTASLSGTMGASTGRVTMGAGTYGGDYLNGLVGQCAIYNIVLPTVNTREADSITAGMNNPAGSGTFFVGNNDMRGIVWPLQKLLTPPMCVVGQQVQQFKFSEGALADPTVPFDTVYTDTEGGMGLYAQWPNWYVVTVPGFYEIDADIETTVNAVNDSAQAWIVVAQEGAQALQANIGTPISNLRYVCPVGETKKLAGATSKGNSLNLCPSWRGYLGAGDMVAVGFEHNVGSTQLSTTANNGGSWLSIRWTGVSNTGDDRAQICSSINGGTVTNPIPFVNTVTQSWTNTASYSYTRFTSAPGTIANRNGTVTQGNNSPPNGAMQYAQIVFPIASINATLAGLPIINATITATNTKTNSKSGGKGVGLLGVFYGKANIAKNPWQPNLTESQGSVNAIASLSTPVWNSGKKMTFTLPNTFFGSLGGQGDIGSNLNGLAAEGILLGNNKYTSSLYNASWKGAAGTWTLTVTYGV